MNLNNTYSKNPNRSSGVSLIELMVAVSISAVLMLGVGSVYFNSSRTYRVQEEFARLQEGARIAVNFMVEDIRMAGYVGCARNGNNFLANYASFLNPFANNQNRDATTQFQFGVTGYEATASGPNTTIDLAALGGAWNAVLPTYLTALVNPPIPGSDIIIVRYADGNGIPLAGNKNSANFRIANSGVAVDNSGAVACHTPSDICAGDILLITDCEKSRLFQATNLNDAGGEVLLVHSGAGAPGNAIPSWGGASQKFNKFSRDDSNIFKASSYAYYVAMNANVPPQPSLFRLRMRPGSVPAELIEGVENMQIVYGTDAENNTPAATGDGVANQYVTAANPALVAMRTAAVPNDNIVSARISLLLRTNNEVANKSTVAPVAKNYILSGLTALSGTTIRTAPDRRIRKVFTTTIKIRNKGLL